MTSRTPDDRPGGDFCEIEGEAPASGHVYHPIRSDDLVWLAREVWSIMDADQRHEFFLAEDVQQGDELPSIGTPWTPRRDAE